MSLGHVYIVLEPVGSARLTCDDDRYYEFMCFDVPKVVRSPGFDQGHDDESQNGRDVKIDILEAYVWTSEWFWVKTRVYRSIGRLPEPPGRYMGLGGREGKGAKEGAPPKPNPNWEGAGPLSFLLPPPSFWPLSSIPVWPNKAHILPGEFP